MNYFPHNPFKQPVGRMAGSIAPVRQKLIRDILWNQPVFKAPALRIPNIPLEPLPAKANGLTQRFTSLS